MKAHLLISWWRRFAGDIRFTACMPKDRAVVSPWASIPAHACPVPRRGKLRLQLANGGLGFLLRGFPRCTPATPHKANKCRPGTNNKPCQYCSRLGAAAGSASQSRPHRMASAVALPNQRVGGAFKGNARNRGHLRHPLGNWRQVQANLWDFSGGIARQQLSHGASARHIGVASCGQFWRLRMAKIEFCRSYLLGRVILAQA